MLKHAKRQAGFSLLELLITVAVIAVVAAIAIPLMQQALLRAHVGAVTTDARAVYTALKQHYVDQSAYPDTGDFALDTFEPLGNMQYYVGAGARKLQGNTADAYDAPDDSGLNQEFWLEFTLAYDSSVRMLISDSDDAPLSGGDYLDGVFLYKNGALIPLQSVNQ